MNHFLSFFKENCELSLNTAFCFRIDLICINSYLHRLRHVCNFIPLLKHKGLLIHGVATRRTPFGSSAAVAPSTDVNSPLSVGTSDLIMPNPFLLIAAFRSLFTFLLQRLQWYVRSEKFRSCLIFPQMARTFLHSRRSLIYDVLYSHIG